METLEKEELLEEVAEDKRKQKAVEAINDKANADKKKLQDQIEAIDKKRLEDIAKV